MPEADIIIINGAVLTMDHTRLRAEAVALRSGRILAVGDRATISELGTPRTRIVDAKGGSVLPGFVESHLHLFVGGAELGRVVLNDRTTLGQASAKLRSYAATHMDEPAIVGVANGYRLFADTVPRLALDRIIPDRPLALISDDHHTVWANTIALQKCELLHGRDLPSGHEVVMGNDGLANGTLLEPEAFGPVLHLAGMGRVFLGMETGRDPAPTPSPQDRAQDLVFLRRGLSHLVAQGITSIVNMDGNRYTLDLLEELRAADELNARVRVPFHFLPDMTEADLDVAAEMDQRWKGDWLNSGFVKMFMDGVVESNTAFMKQDYPGRPGWRGSGRFSAERFRDLATRIDAMGLQMAVHAIGDAAVARVLNGYEAAIRTNGARDLRHRIEHIELADPDDLPRIGALGLIASMQPLHAPENGPKADNPALLAIPQDRWPQAFPMRRLRKLGTHMALASDWPVVTASVLDGIHGAVTSEPWRAGHPKRRLSLHDAIHGYTLGGAYAEHSETTKGSLSPGKFADVVILDRDIEAVAPQEIKSMAIRATICGGRFTFDRLS